MKEKPEMRTPNFLPHLPARTKASAARFALRHGGRRHDGYTASCQAARERIKFLRSISDKFFRIARARSQVILNLQMKNYYTTILVIEDDPNDQLLIEAAFRKIGVSSPIHVVGDGAEAIAYMSGEGKFSDRKKFAYPTFVMTDLKMRTDGFEVLDFLKKNPEWRVIPAVVLSASSDLDDIKKSYMLGASSYHVKPQSPEQLRTLLKTLHDYWLTCEVPQVDASGKQLETNSAGKLGERFTKETSPASEPHH